MKKVNPKESEHSRLAPSGAKRWMTCPLSIRACQDMPDFESPYALEGTKAHELAEQCLLKEVDAHVLSDDVDISYPVQVYLDYIFMALKFGEVVKMFVEQKFSLEAIHPDIGGTADCVLLTKKGTLEVIDYKHGQGVVVEPKENPQLMIYALGALYSLTPAEQKKIKKIILTVVQPRAPHEDGEVRSWDTNGFDLLKWGQKVLKPAAKLVDSDKASYKVGDHCRFCKALAVCPAQAENAALVAQTDFAAPVLPPPETIPLDRIPEILEKTELFSSWANSVKTYAFHLLKSGQQVEGYKLVEKRSNRTWTADDEALNELENMLGEDGYSRKFISVSQAEKLLKGLGFDTAILQPYWFKPTAGLTLVKESDKRKAVSPVDDFINVGHVDQETKTISKG